MSNFKLTEGETLVAKSKADRTTNTGGIQSGTMYLTSKRLVFCCSPGFSRIALLSKLGSDETTIFAEVARDDIKLKKWLFWNRLIIDGKDTQIVIPKKLLKHLEGAKVLDKAEESEVKGGGPNVKTFFIRLAFVAVGVSILSIPLVNYINQENEREWGDSNNSASLEGAKFDIRGPNPTVESNIAGAYYRSGLDKEPFEWGDNDNIQGAIADFNKAIAINPRYTNAYFHRGNAKRILRDNQGAISDYNKAIAINPQFDSAYTNRGIAKNDLGDYQGAIADLNKAIEIDKYNTYAYRYRGIAKENDGDLKGACADWKEAGDRKSAKLVEEHCQ